jgi:hypothetical protein
MCAGDVITGAIARERSSAARVSRLASSPGDAFCRDASAQHPSFVAERAVCYE